MDIPDEAVEAAARAAAKDEDASNWDDEHEHYRNGWLNRMQVALEAAAPHLMAEAFEQGQKSGLRHADRLVAAAKIGRPELPGPLSPNPYRPTK